MMNTGNPDINTPLKYPAAARKTTEANPNRMPRPRRPVFEAISETMRAQEPALAKAGDRLAMLSPQLLELLRAWWREGRRRSLLLPGGWLFPGRNPVEPLSARQLCRAVRAAAQAAGIKKRVSPHTLRHNSESRIIPSHLLVLT